jgi:hypothetical protein
MLTVSISEKGQVHFKKVQTMSFTMWRRGGMRAPLFSATTSTTTTAATKYIYDIHLYYSRQRTELSTNPGTNSPTFTHDILTKDELALYHYLNSNSIWTASIPTQHQYPATLPAITPEQIIQCLTTKSYQNQSRPANTRLIYIGQHALNAFLLQRLKPSCFSLPTPSTAATTNTAPQPSITYIDDKLPVRNSILMRLQDSPFVAKIILDLNLSGIIRISEKVPIHIYCIFRPLIHILLYK